MFKCLNKGKSTPIAIGVILILVIILGGFTYWQYIETQEEEKGKIASFEECLAQGYPVSEIYPYYCETPKEEIFIKEIEEDDWTSLASSEDTGSNWNGVITLIDEGNKTIYVVNMPNENPKIKAIISVTTEIEDKQGNELLFTDLKTGDVISITGKYQMRGKFTNDWRVRLKETFKVTFSGECINEGKEITQGLEYQCCLGLVLIDNKYCTKCGDLVCKPPENKENCPLDCTEIDQSITLMFRPEIDSIDLENKTFEAKAELDNKQIKIIATDSTKFYSQGTWKVEGELFREDFSLEEFFSKLKNWTGSMRSITVKGLLQDKNIIIADEIFYGIQ